MVRVLGGLMWNNLHLCTGTTTRKPKNDSHQRNVLDYIISFNDGIKCTSMHIDSEQDIISESDHCLISTTFLIDYKFKPSVSEEPDKWVYGSTDIDWNKKEEEYQATVMEWWFDEGHLLPEIPDQQAKYDYLSSNIRDWSQRTLGGDYRSTISSAVATKGRKRLLKINKMRATRKRLRKQQRYIWTPAYHNISEKIISIERALKQDEQQYFDNRIKRLTRELDIENDPQHMRFYQLVKNYQSDMRCDKIMVDADGTPITDKEQLKQLLITQWEAIFDEGHWSRKRAYIPPNQPKIDQGMTWHQLSPFTVKEITQACSTLKTKKATGLSEIPNSMLKHAPFELKVIICDWMQGMWDTGTTPSEMGWGEVTLLHKKGATSDIRNYRTLVVGCNLCKIYLKVIENRLRAMTEKYNILGDMQNGFRQERRCQDNLYILNRLIALHKTKTKPFFVAMLDITKAYDRVDRDILWEKMELLKYPHKMMTILKEIYKAPMGIMNFQGVSTGPLPMPVGLKQGCVLSPLLFSIYISDLTWELERLQIGVDTKYAKTPGLLFADDMAFTGDQKTMSDTLAQVGLFAERNGIEFSGPKSLVIPVNSKINQERIWNMSEFENKDVRPRSASK